MMLEVIRLHLFQMLDLMGRVVQGVVNHIVADVSEVRSGHQCIRIVTLKQYMRQQVERESNQNRQHWGHNQAQSIMQ